MNFRKYLIKQLRVAKNIFKKTNNKNEMLQERIMRKNNTQLLRHIHKLLAQLGQFDVYEPMRSFFRI